MAEYVVDSLTDVVDASDGLTTLREALAAAQAAAGADTITFAGAGRITLDAALGNLTVAGEVTIDGGGDIVIDGADATRLFYVASDANAVFSGYPGGPFPGALDVGGDANAVFIGLTLQNGLARGTNGQDAPGAGSGGGGGGGLGAGGAVFVAAGASATFDSVVFGGAGGVGNAASGGSGGRSGYGLYVDRRNLTFAEVEGLRELGGLGGEGTGGSAFWPAFRGPNIFIADPFGPGGEGGYGGFSTPDNLYYGELGRSGGFGGGGGGGGDYFAFISVWIPGSGWTQLGSGQYGFAGGGRGGGEGAGGGGAGLGGAVFAQIGASLRFTGTVAFSGNTATGGASPDEGYYSDATSGTGAGASLFLNSRTTTTFAPAAGEVITLRDSIGYVRELIYPEWLDINERTSQTDPAFLMPIGKTGAGTLVIGAAPQRVEYLDVVAPRVMEGLIAFTVEAGVLQIDGALSRSSAAVSGTLTGHGGLASARILAGGTLAPGDAAQQIGDLDIAALSFVSGATFAVDARGAAHDRVVVQSVELGGATLAFAASNPNAQHYTPIDNRGAGAVQGTFAGLTEGATLVSGGMTYRISYVGGTGNDVVLSDVRIIVETLADVVNPNDGVQSLREALARGASLPGADDIVFAVPGRIVLDAALGALVVDSAVTLDGGGVVTLDGGDATRILDVRAGATAVFRGLTLQNGFAQGADGYDGSNARGGDGGGLGAGGAAFVASGASARFEGVTFGGGAGAGNRAAGGAGGYGDLDQGFSGGSGGGGGYDGAFGQGGGGAEPYGIAGVGGFGAGGGGGATGTEFEPGGPGGANGHGGGAGARGLTLDELGYQVFNADGGAGGGGGGAGLGGAVFVQTGGSVVFGGGVRFADNTALGGVGGGTDFLGAFGGRGPRAAAGVGDGAALFQMGGVVTFAPGAGESVTVADGVAGTAGLFVSGAGTLVLSGVNTYTGTTTVFGTLRVDGAITGTLWLTVSAGATLATTLGGAPIGVTGPVTLLGSVSLALPAGLQPRLGEAFRLIDNDGTDAVVGSFAGLAEGAVVRLSGLTFQLSYVGGTGNDVTLTVAYSTVQGGAGSDSLTGGAGPDLYLGGRDDDVLLVSGGADTLDGGAGGDFADFSSVAGSVTVDLGATGAQAVGTGSVVLVDIEHVRGTDGADRLTGDGAGNRLNGRAGADTLTGGDGSDIYLIDDAGDRLVELAGQGRDTVITKVSFDLDDAPSVEVLRAGATSSLTLGGSSGHDVIVSIGGDALNGDGGDDWLVAGGGLDRLTGGGGADVLDLGRSDGLADVLVYAAASDSTVARAGRDNVRGFTPGEDKIDLTAFGIVDFAEQVLIRAGANTMVRVDLDRDGHFDDFAIAFRGAPTLTEADFLL